MIRVIIADDHAIVREGLALLLATMEDVSLVGQAANGHEALDLVRSLAPDLAILDNSMPGISGIRAASEIAKMDTPCRVIILTMHSQASLAAQAFKAGVEGFLIKEDAFDQLATAIAAVREGRRYVSPALGVKMVSGLGDDAGQPLTSREMEILKLIAEGRSNRDIARELSISPKTVETHRSRIMKKLGEHSATGLVRHAVRIGLIDP